MKRPVAMNSQSVESLAQANAYRIQQKMKTASAACGSHCVYALDDLEIIGKGGDQMDFFITITNDSANTVMLPFGTPYANKTEYDLVKGKFPAFSTDDASWVFNLASLTDDLGVGIPFLQTINNRFLRKPAVLCSFEVVVLDGAAVNDQKSRSIIQMEIPNQATDSVSKKARAQGQYVDVTSQQVLTDAVSVGEFAGFVYPILPNSTIQINMRLLAQSKPYFRVS